MNVQFADIRRPDGPPLFETETTVVPLVGQHVTLPGGHSTVVRSVHLVWEKPGEPRVAVVVE